MNADTTKCPACGSPRLTLRQPSHRVFYTCDSYGYEGDDHLADQTDLCRAWQTLNRIQTIATTDHESKQAFIDRVNAILNER